MQSLALCATQTQQFCLPKVLLSLASPGIPDPLFQVSPFILLPPLGSQHHINSSDLVFPSSRFFPTQFIVSYTPSASAWVSCLSLLVLVLIGKNTQQPESGGAWWCRCCQWVSQDTEQAGKGNRDSGDGEDVRHTRPIVFVLLCPILLSWTEF